MAMASVADADGGAGAGALGDRRADGDAPADVDVESVHDGSDGDSPPSVGRPPSGAWNGGPALFVRRSDPASAPTSTSTVASRTSPPITTAPTG
jgi:hypothetical protein